MSDGRQNRISAERHGQQGRGDFWSRRKASVAAEAREDEHLQEAAEAEARDAAMAERSDEDILQELGLPDPDTLGAGDDFKGFLTKAVPARIRNRALRRLWASNPVLANVDGLVDYGEDFACPSFIVEKIQTAYQVGKGMTAHVEELARQAEEAEAAGEADDRPEDEAEDIPVTVEAAVPEDTEPQVPEDEPVEVALTEPDPTPDETIAPVRRMRFSFEPAPAET